MPYAADDVTSNKVVNGGGGLANTGYPHLDKPWMHFYPGYVSQPLDDTLNLASFLKGINKDRLSYTAMSLYGKEISYDEMFANVDRYSKAFHNIGVEKNNRIMLLIPTIPEAAYTFLAASQIGAVSDYIDPRPDSTDVSANAKKTLDIIKREKADYIISLDICYLTMLKPIENELKELGISTIIVCSASDSMDLNGRFDYLRDKINYNNLKKARGAATKGNLDVLFSSVIDTENISRKVREAARKSPLDVIPLNDLIKQTEYGTFKEARDISQLTYIAHTSGTSGNAPKPITLTNRNLISSTNQVMDAGVDWGAGKSILHELPFFSPLGAANNFLLSMACGSNCIEVPEFDISEFGYLIKKYHPNNILGTPAWIASLTQCEYLKDEDLSYINRIVYGGDAMSRKEEENLNRWLTAHGARTSVQKGYGMSEFCGCGSYSQGDYNRYESIGIPIPETSFAIVDPNVEDKLVPVKITSEMDRGELAVSSDAVTDGVLDGVVIIPHYNLDGHSYIRTRDIVSMDADGIFYFSSRKDRSFTRYDGYKVKPYEIEKILESYPEIQNCVITSFFDPTKNGLMPIAHIVLSEGISYTKENIAPLVDKIIHEKRFVSRQIPAKIKIRQSMPVTKNGKTDFNALKDEGIDDSDISIVQDETNLEASDPKVIMPNNFK